MGSDTYGGFFWWMLLRGEGFTQITKVENFGWESAHPNDIFSYANMHPSTSDKFVSHVTKNLKRSIFLQDGQFSNFGDNEKSGEEKKKKFRGSTKEVRCVGITAVLARNT